MHQQLLRLLSLTTGVIAPPFLSFFEGVLREATKEDDLELNWTLPCQRWENCVATDIPTQRDGHNCGVYVALYAAMIAANPVGIAVH